MKLSLLLEDRKRIAAMHHSMLKVKEPARQRCIPSRPGPSLAKKVSAANFSSSAGSAQSRIAR